MRFRTNADTRGQTERSLRSPQAWSSLDAVERDPQTPPVSEGDVREVTIETIGNQGTGLRKSNAGMW